MIPLHTIAAISFSYTKILTCYMTRSEIISEYKRIKKALGRQPGVNLFLAESKVSKRMLEKVFGRNAFSSLVRECGDIPNTFSKEKSDLNEILIQYGQLIRRLGKLPISAEWENAKLKPTVSGIEQSHKIKWSELPKLFVEFAQGKPEWSDTAAMIPVAVAPNATELKSEECFVYLMFNSKSHLHKIGISKIAGFREKTLQSEEPSIKMIASKKYINRRIAGAFEKALHETYSHKRERGEWFKLNEDEIKEIKSSLK
jgi:hypothetical protein